MEGEQPPGQMITLWDVVIKCKYINKFRQKQGLFYIFFQFSSQFNCIQIIPMIFYSYAKACSVFVSTRRITEGN